MIKPDLSGVPETLLWTLHNRASESMRADAWIRDEHAVRIYRSLDFDYERTFGKPDGSHAIRSLMFDEAVVDWMRAHPAGRVVELACGLETQFQRVDNGQVRWICVDLPEAIEIRERFLPPSPRCQYIAKSVLDLTWIDDLPGDGPVFVSIQGLLMYFDEAEVRRLLQALLGRLQGCTLMFDTIPRWFSRKTLAGFWKTPHYKTPAMPWGVNRDELAPLFKTWGLSIASLTDEPYRRFRVFPWGMAPWMARLPWLRTRLPTIVRIEGKVV